MSNKKPNQNFLIAEQRIAAQQAEEQINPRLNVDQASRLSVVRTFGADRGLD